MSVSNVSKAMGNGYSRDLDAARAVGGAYDAAQTNYNRIIVNGTEQEIAAAQHKLDKAQERFASFMATQKQGHDLIMQMIQMLSR